MGTALVFLLVLALCGFIAYIGDLLGRRLGKKRLTVFGLRPKHTAILLTIVTGIVIASMTLGLALLIVPGFSKVVTQGERMLAINSRLTQENDGLQKQNDTLRQDTAQEKKRNHQLSGQNVELDKKNRELQKSNETIAAQNASLTKSNQSLAAGNQALKGQNQELATGNRKLAGVNQGLQKQQKSLFLRVVSLRKDSQVLRKGHYLFRAQEDIVRQAMPPNPPSDIVKSTIEKLDFEVRSRAAKLISERKGGRFVDPTTVKTRLVPPPGFSSAPQQRELLESWLIRRASTIRDTQILWRAVSAQNCIEGGPVVFYIDPFPNRLVFKQGDVVATKRIDGRSPRWQILHDLIYFLQNDVRGRATASPNNMLPSSESLGELNLQPIVDTMDEISLRPGFVSVAAVTTTDIHRAGQLNVEFQVKPGDF